MNGDLLVIEYDTILYINELKMKIEECYPQLSIYSQKLIRLSDEMVNPCEIHNGDVFAILIDDPIRISFFHEALIDIEFENKNNSYVGDLIDVYTIYINNKYCMDFLYNVTKKLYAHERACILHQSIDCAHKFRYKITDTTQWYSSLLECIESQPNGNAFTDEIETRFHMHRVMNELLDYVELIENIEFL
jgi:hypothetical protein